MKLIEQLTHQVENILYKQKTLESENFRLKERLNQLENANETIAKLESIIEKYKEERAEQEKELELLTSRLEKLLQ